jgi:pectate lyase
MALRPLTALSTSSRSVFCSLILGLTVAFTSCAQPESGTEGTGGTGETGSGGTTGVGTGGITATGGATGTGGIVATGGTPGTGGTKATGGATGTGGTTTTGTGGANVTGGTTGTGGTAGTGGGGTKATGGTTGTGGTPATGGATGTGGTKATGGTGGAAGTTGTGGTKATGGTTGTGGTTSSNPLVGWAASGCSMGSISSTTGGGSASATTVSSASAFSSAVSGSSAAVIHVSGSFSGSFKIGSNKTIVGMSGAKITGNLTFDGTSNDILQNLTVVGLNCSDVASNGDCQDGADAVTVVNGAHHIWIDHLDVSDGSDGNLDITEGSDCVTVSWTKFHYSSSRVSGYTGEVHHFSNLVGGSDSKTSDAGHLRVTWHHDWWADHVVERQPRVRFGQVHIFNNLYTSSGDNYCIGVGVSANILDENNAFIGVSDPIDSTDYSNSASIVVSKGNLYSGTSGQTANKGSTAFTPPYPYTLDAASSVQSEVQSGAGPH